MARRVSILVAAVLASAMILVLAGVWSASSPGQPEGAGHASDRPLSRTWIAASGSGHLHSRQRRNDVAGAERVSEPLPRSVRTVEAARSRFHVASDPALSDVPELRLAALESDDPYVVGNAIHALGILGRVAGDRELIAMIDDPRLRVRQELVRSLGASSDVSAVAVLGRVIAGDDPTLRPLALQALGRLGGDEARRLIASTLDDPRSDAVELAFARAAARSIERVVRGSRAGASDPRVAPTLP
jgi:hypothetical protein